VAALWVDGEHGGAVNKKSSDETEASDLQNTNRMNPPMASRQAIRVHLFMTL
jgi:hypothetical protein